MSKTVQHTGIIERIEPLVVYVRIEQLSACSRCHAQTACRSVDSRTRMITVENVVGGNFAVQERVMLCGQYNRGILATLLAYIFPMLLVVVALFAGVRLTDSEVAGGGVALLTLLPYYGLIYLMRDKLKRKFVFTLSKIPAL